MKIVLIPQHHWWEKTGGHTHQPQAGSCPRYWPQDMAPRLEPTAKGVCARGQRSKWRCRRSRTYRAAQPSLALPPSLPTETVSTIGPNIHMEKLRSKTTRVIRARARARGAGKNQRGVHIGSSTSAGTLHSSFPLPRNAQREMTCCGSHSWGPLSSPAHLFAQIWSF